MRSIKINIPFVGRKTRSEKIFAGDNTLTFTTNIDTVEGFMVVLSNSKGYKKCVSISGRQLEGLKINIEGFEWFWIERTKLLGRSGEIVGVVSEKITTNLFNH